MKSKTPVLTVNEINEVIIGLLKEGLDKFCFGEYKDETKYPVALTKTKIKSDNKNYEYTINMSAKKDESGKLKSAMITIARKEFNK